MFGKKNKSVKKRGLLQLHDRFPKVLVISHNAFSEELNNGKTLTSIFSHWPKEQISQLFFHNETPSFSVCSNFFKITDSSLLQKRKENIGEVVKESSLQRKGEKKSRLLSFTGRYKGQLLYFFRDLLWSFKRWDNHKLQEWLNNFKPEVIFFVGGGNTFSHKIAYEISKKYSIPIYLYYTDDYITPTLTLNIFSWINWIRLNIVLKKVLKNVNKVFVIGNDMAIEFSKRLKKPCVTIMNAVDIEKFQQARNYFAIEKNNSNNVFRIAYFGGLHLNRWKSLELLGQVCDEIYLENHKKISLSIYTNQHLNGKILTIFDNCKSINFKGSISGGKIIDEMQKYDALVHVESFDRKMMLKTRLSISTKIPEYLASGKIIIAIGPKNISSIKYLQKLRFPYVITAKKKKKIKEVLLQIISDTNDLNFYEMGLEIVRESHSIDKNRKIIRENLSEFI